MNYFERAKFFRTKKRLGQNFLINESVINNIIEKADIKSDDVVVEIGAGVGFVTEQLVKHAKKVYAIELDEAAISELKKIDAQNLEIIHNDILKTDISQFAEGNKKLKIVANIPYYITTPIIVHLLGEIDDLHHKNREAIESIILMVQFEAGQRIVANENSVQKQYGHLSILSQFYSDIEFIQKVPARAFYPAPKVDSAILKFTVRETPIVKTEDYSFLRKVTKAAFQSRRKNIKNSLTIAGFQKNAVEKTLNDLGISQNERGENFSISDFAKLAETLKGNL